MSATILLTGFEPFGQTPVNPAEKVASALDGASVAGGRICSLIVENSFGRSIAQVKRAIATHRPALVVMLGEYGGRAMITFERFAHNFDDSARYALADNAGVSIGGAVNIPDAPLAYRSTLPLNAMTHALRRAGVPADISDTAGTNVCNHLLFGILHHIRMEALPMRAGWIHLPHLPEVAALDTHLGAPSMALDTSITGVRIAIEAALAHAQDDPVSPRSCWQI